MYSISSRWITLVLIFGIMMCLSNLLTEGATDNETNNEENNEAPIDEKKEKCDALNCQNSSVPNADCSACVCLSGYEGKDCSKGELCSEKLLGHTCENGDIKGRFPDCSCECDDPMRGGKKCNKCQLPCKNGQLKIEGEQCYCECDPCFTGDACQHQKTGFWALLNC